MSNQRSRADALRRVATAINFEIIHTLNKTQVKSEFHTRRSKAEQGLTQAAKVAASCSSWSREASKM